MLLVFFANPKLHYAWSSPIGVGKKNKTQHKTSTINLIYRLQSSRLDSKAAGYVFGEGPSSWPYEDLGMGAGVMGKGAELPLQRGVGMEQLLLECFKEIRQAALLNSTVIVHS